jgi:hypothetical protein
VEYLRARKEKPQSLIINDPQPVSSADDVWRSASQLSLIGIFILMLAAAFYAARPVLMPVLAAVIVAMTFAPIIKLRIGGAFLRG